MKTVEDALKVEEGWRPHVYPDSLGFATLGYGFLVDSRRGAGIPKPVADYWLAYVIGMNRVELDQKLPWLQSQPQDVQDALVLMAYQIGVTGVLGFHRMLEALQSGNRPEAAAQLLDSELHKQTPARTERLAAKLKGES